MQNIMKDVLSKKQVVGQVSIPVYETIDELLSAVDGDVIVQKFNKANTVDLMSAERQKHTGKVGKQKRKQLAYNLLTTEEAARLGSMTFTELEDFLMSDEMQKRVDAELAKEEAAVS